MADDAPVPTPEPKPTFPDDRTSRRRINEAILLNERRRNRKKNIRALATELGVDYRRVYEQRHKLRMRGMLPPVKPKHGLPRTDSLEEAASAVETAASTTILSGTPTSISTLLQMIEKIEVPNEDQQRKILAFLIENGNDQTKVTAISKLREMDSAMRTSVGPAVPLTAAERIDRGARILLMMGRREAIAAFKQAFPNAKPLSEAYNARKATESTSQEGPADASGDGAVD